MTLIERIVRKGLTVLFPYVASAINQVVQPLLVLAYHRVADLKDDPQLLAVSKKNFADQMQCIVDKGYPVLPFDAQWPPRASNPRICLTFDDGYADNYLNALPVLEKFGFPATFFISTQCIETGNAYWWDFLEDICKQELSGAAPAPFNAVPCNPRSAFYEHCHIILKNALPDVQEHYLEMLCEWSGVSRKAKSSHRSLTIDEVVDFAHHPLVTLGAHTHSHPVLSNLPSELQKQEIEKSMELLARWTGKRPEVFAYPYGSRHLLGFGGDYNSTTMHHCKELGLRKVAANYPSQVRPWSNLLALPRHLVRNWTAREFEELLNGFLTAGHF